MGRDPAGCCRSAPGLAARPAARVWKCRIFLDKHSMTVVKEADAKDRVAYCFQPSIGDGAFHNHSYLRPVESKAPQNVVDRLPYGQVPVRQHVDLAAKADCHGRGGVAPYRNCEHDRKLTRNPYRCCGQRGMTSTSQVCDQIILTNKTVFPNGAPSDVIRHGHGRKLSTIQSAGGTRQARVLGGRGTMPCGDVGPNPSGRAWFDGRKSEGRFDGVEVWDGTRRVYVYPEHTVPPTPSRG
jgi:hypothetical protein